MKLCAVFRSSRFVTVAGVACLLLSGACSHQKPKTEDAGPGTSASVDTGTGSSDEGNALGLRTVHFPFDSSAMDGENKAVLLDDARILSANPSVKIQVEGYCDARGGIQYNVALGDKRATAVKHLLEDEGIADGRITTVSYGKERPVDPTLTEAAYAKNRRANLAITAK